MYFGMFSIYLRVCAGNRLVYFLREKFTISPSGIDSRASGFDGFVSAGQRVVQVSRETEIDSIFAQIDLPLCVFLSKYV